MAALNHMRTGLLTSLITTAYIFLVPGTAEAEPKVMAGTMTCKGEGGVGLVIGSQQQLECTYQPASGRPAQRYSGKISKFGLDIGVKGPSILVWTVLGSTNDLTPGALEGSYAGVSADVAVGIGAGANVLLGGSMRSIVLQPLSIQGEQGLNIAVGVSELSLSYEG